jgi:hypothetical protein
MEIKDSGTRREFSTGAVRDIAEGKGRCDLLPLDVVGLLAGGKSGEVFNLIDCFVRTHKTEHLMMAIEIFGESNYSDRATMLLEVAKHFEAGCQKYGERNWEKGIYVHCYVDSGVRHLLKYLRGDTDEPHDRAFVWNMLCCIWTMMHHPELNDLPKVKGE